MANEKHTRTHLSTYKRKYCDTAFWVVSFNPKSLIINKKYIFTYKYIYKKG